VKLQSGKNLSIWRLPTGCHWHEIWVPPWSKSMGRWNESKIFEI